MENKCSGLFGLLFGHKFQPVYHTQESIPDGLILNELIQDVDDFYVAGALQAAKLIQSTYVKHVCKRCGQTR